MMGFVTLSSMFVGNMVLFLVFMGHGEVTLALLPLLGSTVTGMGLTRILMVPAEIKTED